MDGGKLSRAHALAQAAEDLESQGNLFRAIEARQRAEAEFKTVSAETNDATARATLEMLAAQQRQAMEALQRRRDRGMSRAEGHQTRHSPAANVDARQHRERLTRSVNVMPSPLRKQPLLPGLHPPPSASTSLTSTQQMLHERGHTQSPVASSLSSPADSVFPEGSYLVLQEPDPLDPFTTFNAMLDSMLQTLSNPVAFAMVPIPTRHNLPLRTARKHSDGPPRMPQQDLVSESFFVVPESRSPGNDAKSAEPSGVPQPNLHGATPPAKLSKTLEELAVENSALKNDLDTLSRQYHQMVQERLNERETLKGSIINFGKEVRREAERAASQRPHVVTAGDVPASSGQVASTGATTRAQDLEAQLASLRDELAAANTAAAKYKGRYDQLRDAIKKKRATRDAETAAAAAATEHADTRGIPVTNAEAG